MNRYGNRRDKKKRAFSLAETLVVMLIISMVGLVTIPIVTKKRSLATNFVHGKWACTYDATLNGGQGRYLQGTAANEGDDLEWTEVDNCEFPTLSKAVKYLFVEVFPSGGGGSVGNATPWVDDSRHYGLDQEVETTGDYELRLFLPFNDNAFRYPNYQNPFDMHEAVIYGFDTGNSSVTVDDWDRNYYGSSSNSDDYFATSVKLNNDRNADYFYNMIAPNSSLDNVCKNGSTYNNSNNRYEKNPGFMRVNHNNMNPDGSSRDLVYAYLRNEKLKKCSLEEANNSTNNSGANTNFCISPTAWTELGGCNANELANVSFYYFNSNNKQLGAEQVACGDLESFKKSDPIEKLVAECGSEPLHSSDTQRGCRVEDNQIVYNDPYDDCTNGSTLKKARTDSLYGSLGFDNYNGLEIRGTVHLEQGQRLSLTSDYVANANRTGARSRLVPNVNKIGDTGYYRSSYKDSNNVFLVRRTGNDESTDERIVSLTKGRVARYLAVTDDTALGSYVTTEGRASDSTSGWRVSDILQVSNIPGYPVTNGKRNIAIIQPPESVVLGSNPEMPLNGNFNANVHGNPIIVVSSNRMQDFFVPENRQGVQPSGNSQILSINDQRFDFKYGCPGESPQQKAAAFIPTNKANRYTFTVGRGGRGENAMGVIKNKIEIDSVVIDGATNNGGSSGGVTKFQGVVALGGLGGMMVRNENICAISDDYKNAHLADGTGRTIWGNTAELSINNYRIQNNNVIFGQGGIGGGVRYIDQRNEAGGFEPIRDRSIVVPQLDTSARNRWVVQNGGDGTAGMIVVSW